MRQDLLFPTHYDSFQLNNYWRLYALIRPTWKRFVCAGSRRKITRRQRRRRGDGIGTVFDGGDTLAGAAGPDQSFFLIPGIHVRD